jgi:4'-phosphopantetheinyl transferase
VVKGLAEDTNSDAEAMNVRPLEVHPEVRLWVVDLDAPGDDRDGLALLSADEALRAQRFTYERHRLRFVACRVALRRALGIELDTAPASIAFTYGAAGKPAVAAAGTPPLRFNVSHSDGFALLALTRTGEIGVDLEKRRAIDDIPRLAKTAFSATEQLELHAVDPDARMEAFFNGWTRKEAYLKARGDGLTGLHDFDVSLTPGARPVLTRVVGRPDEPSRWTLVSFTPIDGFAAALCLESRSGDPS